MLTFDTLVVAKIRAHNKFGWSDFSSENVQGAYVQVEPVKIDEIKLDVAKSTLTSLELSWP